MNGKIRRLQRQMKESQKLAFGGILASFLGAAILTGSLFSIADSCEQLKPLQDEIYTSLVELKQTPSYQKFYNERVNELTTQYADGKITKLDYNSEIQNAKSENIIANYAEIDNHPAFEEYQRTRDAANILEGDKKMGTALAVISGILTITGASISVNAARDYDKTKEEYEDYLEDITI
ncbi:MAG: hypothetical protein IJA61_02535 [Clostridia bacterium]|nr:hypothetical protein [Clostridia bacterium]